MADFITEARMSVIAITAAGTIAGSFFGKKSEEAKQKQLEAQRLTLDGPEKSIKDKLSDVAFKFETIRDSETRLESNMKTDFDDIETKLKRIEKFAEPKLTSDQKGVQDLFETAAAARNPESTKQPEAAKPESSVPEASEIRRPKSVLPWMRSKLTRSDPTQGMDR
ncbi:hypothetical protein [Nocardiopsis prasina]|uniref:hypothetical protein n=1 Tax=Nocardiopsis prasina TaxID=2015 RepID=UPI0012696055|nr:hypothetical protein [Nocardiopsis prasina]